MNIRPTPESDEVFGPRVTGIRSRKCRDLERRLAECREILFRLDGHIRHDLGYVGYRPDFLTEYIHSTSP